MKAESPTILVADDTQIDSALLVRILRSQGFRALAAFDGAGVRQVCAGEAVDLVLLDPALPGESGFAVCSSLKSEPRTSDIPVIFLSALDDPNSRVAGFNAGGVDYIGKPFSAKEVLARVRVHLRLRLATECMIREQKAHLDALRQAQQAMLVMPEDVEGAKFAVDYRPLDAVGGDFYDVVPLGGGAVGYFVADISGHGVGASFLTAALKALLRESAGPLFAIEDAMRNMNAAMRATLDGGQFFTACYARLSGGSLSLVSAGHPPLILVTRAGEARVIDSEGDPLGVFGQVVFEKQDLNVNIGDRFYLYTDGLVENAYSPGRGRAAGIGRLREACARVREMELDAAVHAIADEVAPERGAVDDDRLLLGVEVKQ